MSLKFKDKLLLKKEVERFKQNLFNSIQEVKEHKNEVERLFNDFDRELHYRKREIIEVMLTSEKNFAFALSSVNALFLMYYMYILSKAYENEKFKEKYLNKMKEINNKFELYKKIVNDYAFVKNKEYVANEILEKDLEQVRENQENFFKKMQAAIKFAEQLDIINEEQLAIKAAIAYMLQNNYLKYNKQEVFLLKDYLNEKFNTQFTIDDMITIKEYTQKYVKNLDNFLNKNFDITLDKLKEEVKQIDKFKNLTKDIKELVL